VTSLESNDVFKIVIWHNLLRQLLHPSFRFRAYRAKPRSTRNYGLQFSVVFDETPILGAFTGRGQGGPCLTDAAHRPLPMLPSQTCRYAATRTMPQRSSRL